MMKLVTEMESRLGVAEGWLGATAAEVSVPVDLDIRQGLSLGERSKFDMDVQHAMRQTLQAVDMAEPVDESQLELHSLTAAHRADQKMVMSIHPPPAVDEP